MTKNPTLHNLFITFSSLQCRLNFATRNGRNNGGSSNISFEDLPPDMRLSIFEPVIKACIENAYFTTKH